MVSMFVNGEDKLLGHHMTAQQLMEMVQKALIES
jgi:hypothetical protein